MGDFDRHESAGKKDESRKLIMLGTLGFLLLGLIWFQFMKKSPQATASTNVGPDPAAAPAGDGAPGQTPEQAMAELRDDPTAGLLTAPAGPRTLDSKPPRNPFRMADAWRASLFKPEPGPISPAHVEAALAHPSPTPLTLSPENFKLSGIVRQGPSLFAIINNKIVTVGSTIGKARVVDIRDNGVSLQHVDSPDGPLLQLSSQPPAESN